MNDEQKAGEETQNTTATNDPPVDRAKPITISETGPGPEKKKAPVIETKKVYTRNDIVHSVTVPVHLPYLFPGFEPWVFKFNLKLSVDAEERRQEYNSLSAAQQTIKTSEQALDEVCDLMQELPTGFGDLQATGGTPGHAFRSYVETATQDAKDILYKIVEGASGLYWSYTAPREFRQ